MLRPLLLALPLFLAACASQTPPDVSIPPGQYAAAFNAAKSALTGYRFELERVDARAGVITTRPKHTGGLATPWDLEQSSLCQDWEDTVNDQQRTVRITFEPAATSESVGQASRLPDDGQPDLRQLPGPLTAHIDVVLERTHKSGQRLEPTAVQFSTQARDPDLEARALWPSYSVAFAQDPDLARRLADQIRRSLGP